MAFTLSAFLRQNNESLVIRRSDIYHALNEFHAHPDLELLHVTEGKGTLLIGETPVAIRGGELILLGCNVPHLFRFEREGFVDPIMRVNPIKLPLSLLMLHFDPNVFGESFIDVPENELIKQLLKKASDGLLIEGAVKEEALDIMNQMAGAPPTQHLIQLLTLLNRLAETHHQPLSREPERTEYNR